MVYYKNWIKQSDRNGIKTIESAKDSNRQKWTTLVVPAPEQKIDAYKHNKWKSGK